MAKQEKTLPTLLQEEILRDLVSQIETHSGSCTVEIGEEEYTYKWRDGKAVVTHILSAGEVIEYAFSVSVKLDSTRHQNSEYHA